MRTPGRVVAEWVIASPRNARNASVADTAFFTVVYNVMFALLMVGLSVALVVLL